MPIPYAAMELETLKKTPTTTFSYPSTGQSLLAAQFSFKSFGETAETLL
jgi:hypothetical protein